jgi:hypothetical protein
VTTCWVVVAISWVGVTLAELGRFSPIGVLGGALLLVSVGFGARAWQDRRRRTVKITPGASVIRSHTTGLARGADGASRPPFGALLEMLLFVALLLLAARLYFQVSEAIFGTDDAGLRLNAAAHLAQAGQIPITMQTLPVAALTGTLAAPLELYDTDPFNGHLLPQFSGVLESWEALALSLVDLPKGLLTGYQQAPTMFPQRPFYLVPALATFTLVVLYAALRRAFSPLVAMVAVAGLALSYPEIYFARQTMAEIPTQLFCAIALLGLVSFWEQPMASGGALAGAALGLAFLTHVDAFLLYVPAALWLVSLVARRRFCRAHLVFFAVAGALLLQGCAHYVVFEYPYVETNFGPEVERISRHLPLVVGGLIAAILGLAAIVFVIARRPARFVTVDNARVAAAAGFVAAVAFAYLVRPLLQPAAVVPGPDPLHPTVFNAGVGLVILSRYVGPLTFGLAIGGMALFIARGRSRLGMAIFAAGTLYLVVFGWNALVAPQQPFWVRRFLPEVIPMLYVFAGYVVGQLSRIPWQPAGRAAVVGLLGIAIPFGSAQTSLPLWTEAPEYQTGLLQANAFAQRLPVNDVVILDRTEAARWLALPLTFLFRRETYVVYDPSVSQEELQNAVTTWLSAGKSVTFITPGGTNNLDLTKWAVQPLFDQRLRFSELSVAYFAPPTTEREVDLHLAAYQLRPLRRGEAPTLPTTVYVGTYDFPSLVGGFYSNEYDRQQPYRYTAAEADVVLPRPASSRTRIAIRAAGQRPVGVPPATLHLFVDGAPIGSVTLPASGGPDDAAREYAFDASVPTAPVAVPLRLHIMVNSWRPSDYGYADTRDLGVAIDLIQERPIE